MKTHDVISTFLLTVALLAGCSASKQAHKQAKEYEKAGLYVESAQQDLKALRKDKNFKDAKVHLRKVAPLAYQELLTRAENLTAAENWRPSVIEYRRLADLLTQFHRYGVVLETVNVRERLTAAERKAAAYHYEQAESFAARAAWRQAAYAYLDANDFVENYNNSLDQAMQAFIKSGDQLLREKDFAGALDSYAGVLEISPNHEVATKKSAAAHYLYGKQLFTEGQFREALDQFEACLSYIPGYRDAEEWVQRAYDEAVQYVAIFPFLNRSESPIDGYQITSDILLQVTNRDLKFVDFMPHPETVSLLSKLTSNRYGRFSETDLLSLADEEGLDAFVWGTIHDVDARDFQEKFKEYGHDRVVTVQDSTGNDVEQTETIYYREYTRKREVRVRVAFRILATETGRILEQKRYNETINDVANWVAYQGSIYDLPESKRALLDAPRDPRPVPELANQLLASIAHQIAHDVIRFYQ